MKNERRLLGLAILDGNVLNALRESRVSFRDETLATVWSACIALNEQDRSVDLVTLRDVLKEQGRLEDIGGVRFLAGLTEVTGLVKPSGGRLESCGDGSCVGVARVRLREEVMANGLMVLLRANAGYFSRDVNALCTEPFGLSGGEDALCEYLVAVAARLADRAADNLYPLRDQHAAS